MQEKTEAMRKAETLPKAELGNLPANIMLCIGKPYMLTLNVDVSDGLVNGSVGILQYIQYDTLRGPERIWLHFGELGSKIAIRTVAAAKSRQLRALDRNIQQNWTPFERRTVTCVIDKKSRISLRRCQLPVVQASAITIHKSQGGTYENGVYSHAKSHPQKLVYVALSPATDINGLYLTNVDNDFTFYHGKPNPDRALLDEFRRLQSHKLQTVTAKCNAMIEQPHLFSVAALNVRSLPAHSKDVHHDPILRHASVLRFSETWMDPKQAVEIMDYQYCCGVSREHNRAAGVAIYVWIIFVILVQLACTFAFNCITNQDIVAWQQKYLHEIVRHRQDGQKIFHLNEMWVTARHTVSRVWVDTTVASSHDAFMRGLSAGLKQPSGKGQRLIVTHIGSDEVFVDGCLDVFRGQKTGDCHEEMDGARFEKWFDGVLDKLPTGSVMVMDNTSYHSRRLEAVPTTSSPKDDIRQWLTSKKISWDPKMLKKQLLDIVPLVKLQRLKYRMDIAVETAGCTVVRLPPYHCEFNSIELIWAQIENGVAARNTTFKIVDVGTLLNEQVDKVTTDI
ncbi:uncharacterized protein ISCGN_031380 [Ixodes scapularis]